MTNAIAVHITIYKHPVQIFQDQQANKDILTKSGKLKTTLRDTYFIYLYLKSCLWIAKVCSKMFDGFVSPIESIATPITMPVGASKFLCTFNRADNVTVVTTSEHLQT